MQNYYSFPKTSISRFFDLLAQIGKIWAPVRVSEQSFSFKPVTSYEDVAFEALRTILPPKKLFFTPEEKLFSFTENDIQEALPSLEKEVLFGVHPCDLAGLNVMDTIYSAAPQDNHYMRRRSRTLIVGLSCLPDKHCFCESMGTDSPKKGYYLFLTDIGDYYFVQVQTPEGLELIDLDKGLFSPASSELRERFKQFWSYRSTCFTNKFESDNVPAIVDMEWDNKLWDELAQRCLSCGNCTPVCPTCYCFDIVDISSLDGKSGERKREWDSCQIVSFAKVAGDFNFRPGPVDRLKFWYRHKLHGFDDPYGFPTCVGCGRCTVSCPSGIDDIVGVVLQLQGKQMKKDSAASNSQGGEAC